MAVGSGAAAGVRAAGGVPAAGAGVATATGALPGCGAVRVRSPRARCDVREGFGALSASGSSPCSARAVHSRTLSRGIADAPAAEAEPPARKFAEQPATAVDGVGRALVDDQAGAQVVAERVEAVEAAAWKKM